METFAEVIARLSANTETPIPEPVITELNAGYAHDISIREAAIADRDAQIVERDKLVAEKEQAALQLRAANYDLLKRVSAPKDDDPDTGNDQDNTPKGINSLFGP
jgi:rRNA-processing protein FCF1